MQLLKTKQSNNIVYYWCFQKYQLVRKIGFGLLVRFCDKDLVKTQLITILISYLLCVELQSETVTIRENHASLEICERIFGREESANRFCEVNRC